MELIDKYAQNLEVKGLTRKVFKNPEGVPLILYIVEPSEGVTKNVVMYGHLDK